MKKTPLWATVMVLIATALPLTAQEDERREHEANRTTRVLKWVSMGRGFIGVQLTGLTPELRAHFGAPEDAGVMISRVEAGGPAEAAGIRVGDILTAVDGERIDDGGRLARAVRRKDEDETVTVELIRDGALESYPITIGKRDRSVLDLSGGYVRSGFGEPGDFDVVVETPGFHFDEDSRAAFEDAMRTLEDRFQSDEWKERLERLQHLDFNSIQERMREVEERLKELEEELEQEGRQRF